MLDKHVQSFVSFLHYAGPSCKSPPRRSGILLWRRSLSICNVCPHVIGWNGFWWLTVRFALSPLFGLIQNNGLYEFITIHGFKRVVFIVVLVRIWRNFQRAIGI